MTTMPLLTCSEARASAPAAAIKLTAATRISAAAPLTAPPPGKNWANAFEQGASHPLLERSDTLSVVVRIRSVAVPPSTYAGL